jgi:hypothetical protein
LSVTYHPRLDYPKEQPQPAPKDDATPLPVPAAERPKKGK